MVFAEETKSTWVNTRNPESGLAVACHAEAWTGVFERTERAFRRHRYADVLPERDEQIVVLDPMSSREFVAQGPFCFVRIGRRHVSPAVTDAVDVDVDADPRLSIAERDDEVGCLAPDALEAY